VITCELQRQSHKTARMSSSLPRLISRLHNMRRLQR